MMQRLKRHYYQSGQALLNIIEQKIKNLKLIIMIIFSISMN